MARPQQTATAPAATVQAPPQPSAGKFGKIVLAGISDPDYRKVGIEGEYLSRVADVGIARKKDDLAKLQMIWTYEIVDGPDQSVRGAGKQIKHYTFLYEGNDPKNPLYNTSFQSIAAALEWSGWDHDAVMDMLRDPARGLDTDTFETDLKLKLVGAYVVLDLVNQPNYKNPKIMETKVKYYGVSNATQADVEAAGYATVPLN